MAVGVQKGSVSVGWCDRGSWSASFGLSFRDLHLYDQAGPHRIVRPGGGDLRKLAGTSGIADGRNDIVRAFLDDTDGEWLFMVDTDMGFAPDTIERLLAGAHYATKPVVGALAFALRRAGEKPFHGEAVSIVPTLYRYLELEDEVGFDPIRDYPRDQMVRVAGTGAACLLMHRRVLTKMRDAVGDAWFSQLMHPTGERGKPRMFSEDLSFCVRLAGLEVPLYVDTSVKTTHEKGALFLDEQAYDEQQLLARLRAEADQAVA